ncbi:MAG: DUF134 domain-containing protein [Oscillospiraceae bacterium]|nr:DUF134 domain-containing protein [Oscillospiraceae bacterium]
MPREPKCRRVCAEPGCRQFSPEHCEGPPVVMSVEELEAVRLCDLEGLDQEEAAARMNVSRGTLQRVLYSARKRMAEALVFGKRLIIEGGNYEIADRECGQRSCCHCRFEKEETKTDE